MIFIGDALLLGGNDYLTKESGVTSIQLGNPQETEIVVENINALM